MHGRSSGDSSPFSREKPQQASASPVSPHTCPRAPQFPPASFCLGHPSLLPPPPATSSDPLLSFQILGKWHGTSCRKPSLTTFPHLDYLTPLLLEHSVQIQTEETPYRWEEVCGEGQVG